MRIRNQRLTVILVPQGSARTYSFQARVSLLVAAVVLLSVLQLVTITLMFTYGRYFHASRQTEKVQAENDELRRDLRQLADLRAKISEGEAVRLKVFGIMAAGTATRDSAGAMSAATLATLPAAEELRAREQDFARSVPRTWPVHGFVTKEFLAAGAGARGLHPGIDIAAPVGTPVRAAASGTVSFAGWDPEYGYMVTVDHGLGMETVYGHNSRLRVDVGQRLERGALLAWVGSTGRSTAPHLHFEIRQDGIPVDPRQYLD